MGMVDLAPVDVVVDRWGVFEAFVGWGASGAISGEDVDGSVCGEFAFTSCEDDLDEPGPWRGWCVWFWRRGRVQGY